ncbi:hypothetical protein KEM63_08075 [Halopseudomonas nanhaiensis]|uniref:hypothetical protein n=1 Tax=Halopseudomonas nanhaiensis TaxID=2830842 RepID=UPI001CBE8009|nr:hypothetical protein [Halopseudomonas nanhaiensis]UAW99907.1 hypothetical protein KEM63_08075 [Halopseudomonas nanhaiensis]
MELKVERDEQSSWTLFQRRPGEWHWSTVKGAGLSANPDPGDFYRRTAAYMGELAAHGIKVHYRDTGYG